MMHFLTSLSAALIAAQTPFDSMLTLARSTGADSVLVERARQHPNTAHRAFFHFRAAARTEDSAGTAALTAAERVAAAIAVAWRDSFHVREAARYRALSVAARQATLAADSIADVGREAIANAGIAVAMRAWRESLRRYEALGDTAGAVDALNLLSHGFKSTEEYDSATACLRAAVDQAQRIGDYRGEARSLGNLGQIYRRRNELGPARDMSTRALALFERIGDAPSIISVRADLGVILWSEGDLAAARRAFEAALDDIRARGDSVGGAWIVHNLGGLASDAGDYPEALARLREALALLRAGGDSVEIADELLAIGQVTIRRGDYPGALAPLLEAAAILRRLGPSPYASEIDVRLELAQARSLMGDLQGARAELARGEAVAATQAGDQRRASLAGMALARGELNLAFNRYAEAQRDYARARGLALGSTDREVTIRNRAEYGQAAVLFRRASYAQAQVTLRRILARPSVDIHNKAQARLLLGEAAWRSGDTASARRTFAQALDTLRSLGAAVDEADVLATLGTLEAEAGRVPAAESLFQRGLARLATRPAPGVVWRLHAGLAGALRSRGDMTNAAKELQAAIASIERTSGGLALEEHRAAFRADKWDVYVALSLVEWARGRAEAAFEVSEQLRARQMLDLLARGRVANSGVSGALASREQDLRHRIGALRQDLDSAQRDVSGLRDPSGTDAAGAGGEAKALAQAEDAYRDLLEEMHAASPAYGALVRAEIASASAVRAALAPDEALLEYLTGDSTTIVFAVTADTVVALDLHVPHEALAARVDFARGMLASPAAGAVRQSWRPAVRRLYQQLVAPVEATGVLAGKRRLLIVPHAELHYLPFAALLVPGAPERFLVDRYVIEYVPSASVWMRLRARPAPSRSGGVLALAPRTAALPGSQAEVEAIGRAYGARAQTLVGREATEHAFRALASGHEIIHLATYGVLNKRNPLFSYVELGRAEGEDGRLEVHEVFGLTLDARLVVLSACQTAVAAGTLSDVPPGDDWVGLVQGFLFAGAGNVLGTLWPVADVTTAGFMDRFYRELAAGRPEAEALAVAQRAAATNSQTAHPFFWAGFTLVRGR